jgi:hypothetical protein
VTPDRWAELRQVGFAVDVHATDREHGTGQRGELCHTMIRFI